MIQVADQCFQLRGRLVHVHLVCGDDEITLIDGGFLSITPNKIATALGTIGHRIEDIKHILLTHGHIDHTRNLAELKRLSGATLYAPLLDQQHIEGHYGYRGLSRICGALESVARHILRYEVPSVDRWFSPGEILPIGTGVEAISLPGHTRGHTGFYFGNRQLLFAGDLFANFLGIPRLPPPWFNVNDHEVRESIRRADAIPLHGGVLISHCCSGTPTEHREHLRKLARGQRPPPETRNC